MTVTIGLPLAEVQARLSELVAQVSTQHERVTVVVHGRPSAVLLAVDELESLEETIAVLSNTEALSKLAQAEAEITAGQVEYEEQLAEAMRRRGRAE